MPEGIDIVVYGTRKYDCGVIANNKCYAAAVYVFTLVAVAELVIVG